MFAATVGAADQNITKERYHALIEKVFTVYRPILMLDPTTKDVTVEENWEHEEINSSVARLERSVNFRFSGGFARFPSMTEDAFIAVVCHEIGHILGGAPKRQITFDFIGLHVPVGMEDRQHTSVEGEADYFSTLKCMRRVLGNDENEAIVASLNVPPPISRACDRSHSTRSASLVCQRSILASMSLQNSIRMSAPIRAWFNRLTCRKAKLPEFRKSPKRKLKRLYTRHLHANEQCRLDTLIAGALCSKELGAHETDYLTNERVCSRSEGYTVGVRPLCWFRPTSADN